MATGWLPTVKEINGINLANYVPHQRSYNSVVFLHKRCLKKPPPKEEYKEKVKTKRENRIKYDKGQQVNNDKVKYINKTENVDYNNDSILEQTIRFAKNIIPLTIPPSEDRSPVFYTIQSSSKSKKPHKTRRPSDEHHDATYDKDNNKKVIGTYKKVRSHKESYSIRESVTSTSNGTMDDLNNNQSLCCTLSEVSEKKIYRKANNVHKKQHEKTKFIVSDSFEALATETVSGDTKIKIHLMNDKDKNCLSDSIKIPILNALKDCISELNNNNLNNEVTTVQKTVKGNAHKLDNILNKLQCIEKKLDAYNAEERSPRMPTNRAKASRLEELGEDIVEVRDNDSSEEELHQEMLNKPSTTVIEFLQEGSGKPVDRGRGEELPGPVRPSSSIGPQPDRPNRIPARFCWTDARRKNRA